MTDNVTSGLPDDITMMTVTLTMGHRQMNLWVTMMSQNKSLIWVMTDITMMMVALAVQHELTAGPIASS